MHNTGMAVIGARKHAPYVSYTRRSFEAAEFIAVPEIAIAPIDRVFSKAYVTME
jgi:hypothetical protein